MTPEQAHQVAHGFLAVALAGRYTPAEERDYVSKRLKKHVFPTGEFTARGADEGIRKLITYASDGNRLSHELLKKIAGELDGKHLALPPRLQTYILNPSLPPRRGRSPGSGDWLQNAAIMAP